LEECGAHAIAKASLYPSARRLDHRSRHVRGEACCRQVTPAFKEHVRQAAQGDVLHNDDTPVKILELMKKKNKKKENGDDG
jgi:hypothetical protein